MDLGGFLIRIRDRIVLIDAGAGRLDTATHQSGSFLDNLRTAGVAPSEVTDVVFTHMHWDHVMWSTVEGALTFPNATFRVHEADWRYFMTGTDTSDQPMMREALAPVEDHLAPFETECEILPRLLARPAPGHTPGSSIFIVQDAGERALLLGDVVHLVGELTEPEWQGMYDVDPSAASRVRQTIAVELERSGDVFAPAHFPELAFGRLITQDGLRRFVWANERGSGPAPT